MLGKYGNNNYGIDFNSGQADTFSLIRNMPFTFMNASICDTTGQLLFYTNGIYVANKNHDTLLNSPGFNPGYFTNYYYNTGIGIYQGALVLTAPGEIKKYYIIHESAEAILIDTQTTGHPLNLAFSIVNMDLDGGLGGLVPSVKDVHAIDDTLVLGRLSAVKHANGRDWWVICHRFYSTTFYKLLITPSGVSIFGTQDIGLKSPLLSYFGQAVFSPDGSKFSFHINDTTLELYDFDRCTGDLSNPIVLTDFNTNYAIIGNAFSPNGRYLYACNNFFIYQFDTWNTNIPSTNQIVATWDSINTPLPTWFAVMKLAPDHKIYIGTYGGSNLLHYIEFPDSAGLACNVVQNTFITPSYNTFSFPNSPNYDLGRLVGSLCDTLSIGVAEIPEEIGISIYPNPAINILYIYFKKKLNIFKIGLTDLTGRIIKEKFYSGENNISFPCEDVASGMYLVTVYSSVGIYTERVEIRK